MLSQWHSATNSIPGMLVFLFFTGIALFLAFIAVLITMVCLRELFRWKLDDD